MNKALALLALVFAAVALVACGSDSGSHHRSRNRSVERRGGG